MDNIGMAHTSIWISNAVISIRKNILKIQFLKMAVQIVKDASQNQLLFSNQTPGIAKQQC